MVTVIGLPIMKMTIMKMTIMKMTIIGMMIIGTTIIGRMTILLMTKILPLFFGKLSCLTIGAKKPNGFSAIIKLVSLKVWKIRIKKASNIPVRNSVVIP